MMQILIWVPAYVFAGMLVGRFMFVQSMKGEESREKDPQGYRDSKIIAGLSASAWPLAIVLISVCTVGLVISKFLFAPTKEEKLEQKKKEEKKTKEELARLEKQVLDGSG